MSNSLATRTATKRSSTSASSIPIQFLGPVEKGRHASLCGYIGSPSATSHLSGTNSFARGQKSERDCMAATASHLFIRYCQYSVLQRRNWFIFSTYSANPSVGYRRGDPGTVKKKSRLPSRKVAANGYLRKVSLMTASVYGRAYSKCGEAKITSWAF